MDLMMDFRRESYVGMEPLARVHEAEQRLQGMRCFPGGRRAWQEYGTGAEDEGIRPAGQERQEQGIQAPPEGRAGRDMLHVGLLPSGCRPVEERGMGDDEG